MFKKDCFRVSYILLKKTFTPNCHIHNYVKKKNKSFRIKVMFQIVQVPGYSMFITNKLAL